MTRVSSFGKARSNDSKALEMGIRVEENVEYQSGTQSAAVATFYCALGMCLQLVLECCRDQGEQFREGSQQPHLAAVLDPARSPVDSGLDEFSGVPSGNIV